MSKMSAITTGTFADSEKPVQVSNSVQFPPFPEPSNNDFDDNISEDERTFFMDKYKDLNIITQDKTHCTACDRHLGLNPKNENRMKIHPMLRTLVCQTCHSFYNSGEFEKGDDGSELYCRWCGQGGQVYCCSDCPHVFCAKCIKRNLGVAKIKEIEALDDWKCFKCNPGCLKDLRAICWAALRYCDLKNRIAYKTQDAALKEKYLEDCSQDHAECCKSRVRRKEKLDSKKKEAEAKKSAAAAAVVKIPPTIQVKKFASMKMDDNKPTPKKPIKRPASPKPKPNIMLKTPLAVGQKFGGNTYNVPPMKKIRLPGPNLLNPIRVMNERKQIPIGNNFIKIRPKNVYPMVYNGMNTSSPFNSFNSDNINLSLESLTQGLDMSAMSNMASTSQDELVCTPDFPMEPLCEVTEDNTDDDVQCITPGPMSLPKAQPTPAPRAINLSDISPDNIVQMTENDVTVNSATGGLKFRVDPQTLSSNKMYRLPDGRIFAINPNPNMPGGYSATIVAVTEANQSKSHPTKLNRSKNSTPTQIRNTTRNQVNRKPNPNHKTKKNIQSDKNTSSRRPDFTTSVEWYRYNLIDAIDSLEYSLSRLHKIKKEATTSYLRTRTVPEMRYLHKTLENLLNTSCQRFTEIRETINKELRQYIAKKNQTTHDDDDDDDVEILPNGDDDDPIFIDENSFDSSCNETQEVDLTEGGSEHNDSGETTKTNVPESMNLVDDNNESYDLPNKKAKDKNATEELQNESQLNGDEDLDGHKRDVSPSLIETTKQLDSSIDSVENSNDKEVITDENEAQNEDNDDDNGIENVKRSVDEDKIEESKKSEEKETSTKESEPEESKVTSEEKMETIKSEVNQNEKEVDENDKKKISNGKAYDIDISDDMIDDLLKDDSEGRGETSEVATMNISDDIKE